jgi:two-component system NtrC family sensor kinase
LRLPLHSLRTGILAHLIFLIVAAMLLIHVAEVKFSEKDLLQAKVHAGQLMIYALEEKIGDLMLKKENLRDIGEDPRFQRGVLRLLAGSDFSQAVILDARGENVLAISSSGRLEGQDHSLAREAFLGEVWSTQFTGTLWGVIWLSPRYVIISAPLYFENRPMGGVAIRASLSSIYQALGKTQKLVLLYILLDTLVLTIVGLILLSRTVVKPIHKLLRMTGEYKDGDLIPFVPELPRNEIGELSRSLSIMLKRLEENKEDLKAHISSLEKANKELQQAQGELIRSEKLASVGRLAAGVAHEIGNPIGICLGYLELLKKGDVTEDERRDFLGRIEVEITRVNRIIRQLLDFSRPSSGMPEMTHIHDLIMQTVNILRPQPMMEDIQIRFQMEASNDLLKADPNRLQQVLLNVFMNASDALSEKDLADPQDSEKSLIIKTRNVGDRIELEFTDNGPGIPEEELTRVFDPFYTTKEPGRGTGLGLSVCYRIVESLGGSIRAESSRGKGATFIVTLPLGDA